MFRFQDLLHTKIVYPTWMSSFIEWTESLLKDILSDEHLLNTNTNPDLAIAIDKTTGDKVDLTIAQAYAFQVKDVLDMMEDSWSTNRDWQKIQSKKNKKLDIPDMPIQYNIREYFYSEYSDNAEAFIKDYKDASYNIIEEFFVGRKAQDIPLPNRKNYDEAIDFVDNLRAKTVDILNTNQLFFSKPSYDNIWLYCGEIDDEDAPDTHQGLHVVTYTPEQWDTIDFARDYLQANKFILDEDEFVVSIDHYSVLIQDRKNKTYFKDGHTYVHFDKDHKPIDVLTFFPDDDVLADYINVLGKSFDKVNPDYNKFEKESQGDLFMLLSHCHRELSYLLIRTYLVLEMFTVINTKSSNLPEGETVLVERPTKEFVNTKRARQKVKNKVGIDALDEFFVMKELVINPLMTTEVDANSIYSPNDGIAKLREHLRAGHYKVYLPEKPRFGVAHKNNIGRFWYKPTTVSKNSTKGVVVKDYKVEL